MFTTKQPSKIIFGKNTASEFQFPKKSLVITSSGAKSRNWFSYTGIDEKLVFDSVKPNPSMETVEEIISLYQNSDLNYVIGIGVSLKQNLDKAADIMMADKKHLDNNPKEITKKNILHLLETID